MALQTRFDFALPRFDSTPERPNIARAHQDVAEQFRTVAAASEAAKLRSIFSDEELATLAR